MSRKLNGNCTRTTVPDQCISNINKNLLKAHLQQGKCLQNAPQFAWRNQHFLRHLQVGNSGLGPNLDMQLK